MFIHNQYTFEDVLKMTFAQLGAVDDPVRLIATGRVSPMLARYVVRTGQLEARYAGMTLPSLLDRIDKTAALHSEWPFEVIQKFPAGIRVAAVDAFLDRIGTA